ncbi:class I SAM-dependent methyltransferase [Aegicerativicinus sediminis]|uniref:class I SAM-dependent methyltransferase n=1 Tax=Aegicerativicinus sediminis TaxID=2893202 RepID=UPI001E4DF8CB|nr:class I SAM-dependent methyltransferase [Aegicerativicinus sediminis]
MTSYEYLRWFTYPFLPVLYIRVRNDVKNLLKQSKIGSKEINILDVGGRKSPYTIGIPAQISLMDIPQENETMKSLHLGFTDKLLDDVKERRSNVFDLIIEDMTQTTLPQNSYDGIICVEVLEHVENDEEFVKNLAKVLKPNGWAYLTTPNGDFIKNEGPNKNPDHKRHYTKQQLIDLLKSHFNEVEVNYAVKTGKYRVMGLKGFRKKKPWLLFKSVYANLVNRWQSKNVFDKSNGTAHLVAIVFK